jgi:hypothetical protein
VWSTNSTLFGANGGVLENSGTLTHSGTASFSHNAGGVSQLLNDASGTLVWSTNGTVDDAFTNNGTLVLSGGTLTLGSAFVEPAAATIELRVSGPTSSSQYGVLNAVNSAALAGALQVQATGGYTPASSTKFKFLTTNSRTGTFATFTSSFAASVSYTATDATVTAD